MQHPKLLQKLQQLECAVFHALHPSECFCSIALPQHLVDLQLYQMQLHRVLSSALYYLAIEADGERFYKVGITRPSIEERLAEIWADLAPHFQTVEIEVLGVWAHYGKGALWQIRILLQVPLPPLSQSDRPVQRVLPVSRCSNR